MKSKIIYMVLVLATLWAAAAGRGEFAFFLLVFELLFAVCMAAGVWYVAGKLRVSAKTESSAVTRGEREKFILEIENSTVFPVGDIQIVMDVTGAGRIIRHTAADRKSRDSWQIFLEPVHCGFFRVGVTELRVFDYLGLFSAKIRIPSLARTIAVIPRIHLMDEETVQGFYGEEEDNENAARAGTDSQEIFDTRYYHQGDMLKNIHWKLSAKEDELLVKEFSMPAGRMVSVYLDTSDGTEEQTTPDQLDEFLDLAASLGDALVEKEQLFEYVWMEKGTKEALHFEVNGREAFYQALECIPGICQGISDNVLVPEHGGVRITMDGRIQRYFPEGEGRL